MGKAGTGWLYDQLLRHPQFWMPPVKEINYLSRETPTLNHARRLATHRKPPRRRRQLQGENQGWEERDLGFLRDAAELRLKPRDVSLYASLFRHKGDLLSGDISPGYVQLDEATIQSVAHVIPKVRIVLLVRDPVSRTWSRLSMAHRGGKFDPELLQDTGAFLAYLDSDNTMVARSRPAQVVERWRRAAPQIPFQYYFFDDLVENPETTRRQILEFLGADPDRKSGDIPAEHNRKASNAKLPMDDRIRTALAAHFRDEILACAEQLGGAAKTWPEKYSL